MSTLSGVASKGEKGRSKFHTLNINGLYRGESLEPHQQKNIAHGARKHGMQTLGRVPCRRAPANLPSVKSELSGNDPAYNNLVPTGGAGWGSKPGETGPPPTSTSATTQVTTSTTQSTATVPTTVAPAKQNAPASGSSTTVAETTAPTLQPQTQTTVSTTSHGHDKSWSSIMTNSNEAAPNFLAHQSAAFHHEFPSLSGESNGTAGLAMKSDNQQYGPGPSLRPQTEGSWSQGGSRPQAVMGGGPGSQMGSAPAPGPLHLSQGPELVGVRNNLGPSGVGGGPAGLIGPPQHQGSQHMIPPQIKQVMPPFMMSNYTGGFPPNFPRGPVHGIRPARYPPSMSERMMGGPPRPGAPGSGSADSEELTQRPIIKEEDLNKMDDVARDVGWATHDDIDYNQKLAFSDDENQDDETNTSKNARDSKDARSSNQQQYARAHTPSLDRDRDADLVEKDEKTGSREKAPINDNKNWHNRTAPTSLIAGNFSHQVIRSQPGSKNIIEDDELLREKKRQTSEEVATAVQRAKQRKEEEEKRFEETKLAAHRKLEKLNERTKKKSLEQNQGPAAEAKDSFSEQDDQIVHNVNTTLPEWEKDREQKDGLEKESSPADGKDEYHSAPYVSYSTSNQTDNRRDIASRENKERQRDRDRDLRPEREQSNQTSGGGGGGLWKGSSFKKEMPPRFQNQKHKQQQQHLQSQSQQLHVEQRPSYFSRQNSSSSQSSMPWGGGSGGPNTNHISGHGRKTRNDSDVSDHTRDDDHHKYDHKFDRGERLRRPGPESSASSTSSSGGGNRLSQSGYHDGRGKNPPGGGTYNGGADFNRGYGREYNRFDKTDQERERESSESNRHGRHSNYHDDKNNDFKKPHNVYDNRDKSNKESDWRDHADRRNEKERERPPRPDSRDSRTSRESRNSRDSLRDESRSTSETLLHDRTSWADTFEQKERNPTLRHMPITMDKLEASEQRSDKSMNSFNKLTALSRSDKRNESHKKADLQRGDKPDRKLSNDNSNSTDVWSRNPVSSAAHSASSANTPASESWADEADAILKVSQPNTTDINSPIGEKEVKTEFDDTLNNTESKDSQSTNQSFSPSATSNASGYVPTDEQSPQQSASKSDDVESAAKKSEETVSHRKKHDSVSGSGGRDGQRYNDRRSKDGWGSSGSYSVFNTKSNSHRRGGESRGRRGGSRGGHHSNSLRESRLSESGDEVSGDDVSASLSTESGKEEKRDAAEDRHNTRSPKHGNRKYDRDDRNQESRRGDSVKGFQSFNRRYDKHYDNSKSGAVGSSGEGFAPSGEPTRRGRGGRMNIGPNNSFYGTPRKPFNTHASSGSEPPKYDEKDKSTHANSNKDCNEESTGASMNDDKRSNNQPLSSSLIGGKNGSKTSAYPPRVHKKSENEKKGRRKSRENRSRPRNNYTDQNQRNDGEEWETTSENEDDEKHRKQNYQSNRNQGSARSGRRNNNGSSRNGNDKTNYERRNSGSAPHGNQQINGNNRQGYSGGQPMKIRDNLGDKSSEHHGPKNDKDKVNNLDGIDLHAPSVVVVDNQPEGSLEEDRSVFSADSGGSFKEVRSKKNQKQQQGQKTSEDKVPSSNRGSGGNNKDRNKPNKNPSNNQPQGSSSSPSAGSMQNNNQQLKNYTNRTKKQQSVPPRFRKAKVGQQMQMGQTPYDVCDISSINQQSITTYQMKDMTAPPPQNAWSKPCSITSETVTSQTATALHLTTTLTNNIDNNRCIGGNPSTNIENSDIHQNVENNSQRNSPTANDKLVNKINGGRETIENAVLDGSTVPVETIVFENTNYKNPEQMQSQFKNQMTEMKGLELKENIDDNSNPITLSGYKQVPNEIKTQDTKTDPIQVPISFSKSEDSADMKLDFFTTELLTDEKTLNPSQNSTAELKSKIQSVKKVWDQTLYVSPVIEHHSEEGNLVSNTTSFTPPFGNAEDATTYVKTVDTSGVIQEDGTLNAGEIYNQSAQSVPVPGSAASYGSAVAMMKPDTVSSPANNVCKVKPQPVVMSSTHSVQMASPTYNTSAQQTGHISFQPTQFSSMSAIPSPPTMLFNTHTSQQLAQADLYSTPNHFQLNSTAAVLGGQPRSQFPQFPYSLNNTSAFSQQSVFLSSPAHPSSAAPELYQANISQYRNLTTNVYGQSQQLNSNNPMLIPSSGNSHMQAGVKPTTQPIGTLGTKNQYQPATPSAQLFVYPDTIPIPNYLPNSHRATNSVVPAQISSSSYYSATAGNQGGGFFTGSSNLPAAPTQQLHQPGFSLPFSNTPAGSMPNYNSQYRHQGPNAASFLKNNISHVDPAKSPSANQPDVMNSVFSAPSIQSPKPRTGSGNTGGTGALKQPGPQPSPPAPHHKYTSYQNHSQAIQQQHSAQQQRNQLNMQMVRGNMSGQSQHIPGPIQRPMSYQAPMNMGQQQQKGPNNSGNNSNSVHNNSNNNQNRHRQNQRITNCINKMPSPYYSHSQGGGNGGAANVTNANSNANSTTGIDSKNSNCNVSDSSTNSNKQVTPNDYSKDSHDGHKTSANND